MWWLQFPWVNCSLRLLCLVLWGRQRRTRAHHKIRKRAASRPPQSREGQGDLPVVPDKDRNSISSMRALAVRFHSYELMCRTETPAYWSTSVQSEIKGVRVRIPRRAGWFIASFPGVSCRQGSSFWIERPFSPKVNVSASVPPNDLLERSGSRPINNHSNEQWCWLFSTNEMRRRALGSICAIICATHMDTLV